MHAIIPTLDRVVEIQVRTREQHLWAELSEKLADVVDPSIKYGGGPETIRKSLLEHSAHLGHLETYQQENARNATRLAQLEADGRRLDPSNPAAVERLQRIAQYKKIHEELIEITKQVRETIRELLEVDYNSWTDKS